MTGIEFSDALDVPLSSVLVDVKSLAYGARGDNSTDDTAAIQGAITAASTAGGGTVFFPVGTYLITSKLELKSNVTLRGAGWSTSIIRVARAARCEAISCEDMDEGGILNPAILDLQIDGNLAENAGFEGNAVELDAVNPVVERVWIKNGFVNLYTEMSAEDRSSTRPEDGIFNTLRLYDSKSFNWFFEGPHDSQITNVLAKTNEGINISVRKVSVWNQCHAYGNARFAWQLRGGGIHNCIGEGATQAQLAIQCDGSKVIGCEFFSAGARDGKVGIELGGEERTAFTSLISGVKIEGCTNGSVKFAERVSASNTVISGIASQASGNVAAGTIGGSFDARALRVTGGATDNLNVRTVASAGTMEVPRCDLIMVSGANEVRRITATYPGHRLTLIITETARLVDGENLKLSAAGPVTADDTITLVCDGVSWFEAARSVN